jgi:hypothetical protein
VAPSQIEFRLEARDPFATGMSLFSGRVANETAVKKQEGAFGLGGAIFRLAMCILATDRAPQHWA